MDNQWADIIAPGAPPTDTTHLFWWLAPILLAILLGVYYRHRPRPAMRRRLRHLRRTLGDNEVDRRYLTFSIASCLRQACATTRLDQVDFGSQQAQWCDFVEQLQQLQYRPGTPSQIELDKLLEQAIAWLSR